METDLIEFMTEQLGGKEAVAKAYATRPRPLHVQMTFPPDLAARIMEEMGEDDYPSDVVVRLVARYFQRVDDDRNDAICDKDVGKHFGKKESIGGEDFVCEIPNKPDYKMSKGFATFRDGSWYCISTGSSNLGNSRGCASCGANLPGLGGIEGLRVVCEDCMTSARGGEA